MAVPRLDWAAVALGITLMVHTVGAKEVGRAPVAAPNRRLNWLKPWLAPAGAVLRGRVASLSWGYTIVRHSSKMEA